MVIKLNHSLLIVICFKSTKSELNLFKQNASKVIKLDRFYIFESNIKLKVFRCKFCPNGQKNKMPKHLK